MAGHYETSEYALNLIEDSAWAMLAADGLGDEPEVERLSDAHTKLMQRLTCPCCLELHDPSENCMHHSIDGAIR